MNKPLTFFYRSHFQACGKVMFLDLSVRSHGVGGSSCSLSLVLFLEGLDGPVTCLLPGRGRAGGGGVILSLVLWGGG